MYSLKYIDNFDVVVLLFKLSMRLGLNHLLQNPLAYIYPYRSTTDRRPMRLPEDKIESLLLYLYTSEKNSIYQCIICNKLHRG